METLLLIPAPVRDALVQYLSSRPWREVQEVMPTLITLEQANPQNNPAADTKD